MLKKNAFQTPSEDEFAELAFVLNRRAARDASTRVDLEAPSFVSKSIYAALIWEATCLWQDRKIFVLFGGLAIGYQVLSAIITIAKHFLS